MRSPLVLSKIGFDMRAIYDDVLAGPLPANLQSLTDELQGYAEWRDVAPEGAADAPDRRSGDDEPAPVVISADDEPFRYSA